MRNPASSTMPIVMAGLRSGGECVPMNEYDATLIALPRKRPGREGGAFSLLSATASLVHIEVSIR